ncbi:hypothetical protein EQG68_03335 [Flavobacterium piscinae]|uniref:Sulfatase N-terminal domain-containing protein n=2 Tax=Flavobacterium piscinae TaxID=2506424 RepID=A0A4Q1KV95_9FLAO|nr:sulfatase-like hydrolase/transferase [Flavobacterium piscinae]RXR34082.1 hypothetical protein EQG68_03335 [Flavobacterium piscinae]
MVALLLFFTLNFTLFIPRYYFNKNNSSFFPISELIEQKSLNVKKIINRFNDDIFRFNFEFSSVVLVLILVKDFIPLTWAMVLIGLVYLLTCILFFYHYSILGIYKTYPCIASDWKLIKQGVQIALNGYRLQFIVGLVFLIVFLVGLCYANTLLINEIYVGNSFPLLLFCLIIVFVAFIFSVVKKTNPFVFKKEFDFNYLSFFAIQFSILLIQSNRFFCKKTKEELRSLPGIIANNTFTFSKNIPFKSKPNIYFIAIESYGAILHEDDYFKEKYNKLISDFNQNLQSKDWHITSSFSNSPVSGGGSWMAYSSFLMGIKITSDLLYRKLFHEREKYKTQSIFTILEELGYATTLIAAVGGYENFTIEWEETLSFLGTKNVIKFKDLDYTGEKFNFGPSAPDQYMLQKSRALIKEKYPNQPISFFVETINSHANFETPTHLFKNWEECNLANRNAFKPTTALEKNIKENYFLAIDYQLKTITDFVLSENEHSIFVIFGDHQPPLLTTTKNSFKSPIHIISKDKAFITDVKLERFNSTVEIHNNKQELGHEDFKFLFLDKFITYFQEKPTSSS